LADSVLVFFQRPAGDVFKVLTNERSAPWHNLLVYAWRGCSHFDRASILGFNLLLFRSSVDG
jgi:hypothetical protein